MNLGPRAADLRLLPAVAFAWLAAGVAIGVRDAGAAVALAALASGGIAAVAVYVAVVVVGRPRLRAVAAVAALACVAAAVSLAAVAASAGSREPAVLVDAADGRSVVLDVAVTGAATDGRVPGTATLIGIGDQYYAVSSPVLVFAEPGDAVIASVQIGDVMRVTGEVTLADAGEDVAFLVFARGDLQHVGQPPPLLAATDGIRAGFRQLAGSLPGDGGGLLPGLAIGDVWAVPPALNDAMKVSSLSHLTAVSGANCAVVVGLVFAATAALGGSRGVRVGAAAVALVGFVVLVTPGPSVIRAAVMAAVALLAIALGRPARGIPLLSVAVIGLLAFDPWLARSYGFALSVLATGGLLLLAGPLAGVLGRWLPRALALVVAVPIAAQLACQPVLLMLNPSLPLYGVIANMLAEPAAPIATVLGLLACLIAPLAPPIAMALAWLAWIPASWIAAVATFAAGLPGARSPWPVGALGIALLVVLTVAALVAVLGTGPPPLRRAVRVVLAVALVAYLATLAGTKLVSDLTRPADWQYALCDVGQGDATVIRSAGRVALVDTGPKPAPLTACLDQLGIARIDLLVLTHYDLDHVGGVDAVVGRVDRVLVGPVSDAGDTALHTALAGGGAEVDEVARGEQGVLGDLDWQVLWPPPRGVEPGNPASVTLWVTPGPACVTGCLSGILLGDLGEEPQDALLRAAHPLPVDVVKVAHHGSADQSPRLYEQLDATVGLIGVGADNGYGHPTDDLLGILAAVGTAAYRSDLDGLVLVAQGDQPGTVRVWTQKRVGGAG
ncbi:ComEC/Rec2 family competence protein [soil metagenome]